MRKTVLFFCLIFLIACIYISCSKSSSNSNPPPDPCAGVTVTVSGTTTNAASGQNNGSIAASATGGSGFTYSLNNGAFQSSGTFSSLAPGNYTITAKNSNGCSGSKSFTVVAETACTGVNIVIDATATTAIPCGGAGATVTVNASGGTGLTYSINNGAFQASNSFTNVAVGNQTVVVKDANGCTQSKAVTVNAATPGPLFTAVRSILQANCVSCHNNSVQNGGMNWTVDCNIVTYKGAIKIRAVDQAGTPSQMPQPPNPALSAADRQKIVDWINAGGAFNN